MISAAVLISTWIQESREIPPTEPTMKSPRLGARQIAQRLPELIVERSPIIPPPIPAASWPRGRASRGREEGVTAVEDRYRRDSPESGMTSDEIDRRGESRLVVRNSNATEMNRAVGDWRKHQRTALVARPAAIATVPRAPGGAFRRQRAKIAWRAARPRSQRRNSGLDSEGLFTTKACRVETRCWRRSHEDGVRLTPERAKRRSEKIRQRAIGYPRDATWLVLGARRGDRLGVSDKRDCGGRGEK